MVLNAVWSDKIHIWNKNFSSAGLDTASLFLSQLGLQLPLPGCRAGAQGEQELGSPCQGGTAPVPWRSATDTERETSLETFGKKVRK